MTAFETHFIPHNNYPIMLLNTRTWEIAEMFEIRSKWKQLDILFDNISPVFNSVPSNAHTLEDQKDPLSNIQYKRMCSFFWDGITKVDSLKSYQYIMRFDDDACFRFVHV